MIDFLILRSRIWSFVILPLIDVDAIILLMRALQSCWR
jgi:hypothetical protein